jgi:hypothetical protein
VDGDSDRPVVGAVAVCDLTVVLEGLLTTGRTFEVDAPAALGWDFVSERPLIVARSGVEMAVSCVTGVVAEPG